MMLKEPPAKLGQDEGSGHIRRGEDRAWGRNLTERGGFCEKEKLTEREEGHRGWFSVKTK